MSELNETEITIMIHAVIICIVVLILNGLQYLLGMQLPIVTPVIGYVVGAVIIYVINRIRG